jgi:hypothetical protein
VALLLLRVDPVYWIAAAVLIAGVSRLAVALSAPHFLNFAHYPLVIGGLVVAVFRGTIPVASRPIAAGLIGFLAVNFLSWALNGGELLRPLLNTLVFAEPLVLIYVMMVAPPNKRLADLLWRVVIGIALLQVPLGVWQWLGVGRANPDSVQGSFIGSGTGAHVAGAVALLGVLIFICKGGASQDFRMKIGLFAAALPLFAFPVISDAKQAIVCFLPGVLWAVMSIGRISPMKLIVPAIFIAFIFYAAVNLYTPLAMIADQGLLSAGYNEKLDGLLGITTKLSSRPERWLFGLGPGNTVSRVALLTPEVDLSSESSVGAFGLKTSLTTRELLQNTRSSYLSSSSAFSGVASWFGLLGDLGVVGLLLYLGMIASIWRGLSREKATWESASAKGALLMAALLGGVYVWLEEPGFTLLAALVTGLALTRAEQTHSEVSSI